MLFWSIAILLYAVIFPLYIRRQNNQEKEQTTIREIIFLIAIFITFFAASLLITFNPDIYLLIENTRRRVGGIENMIEPFNPRIVSLAEEGLRKYPKTPERIIGKYITYCYDFENWLNIDFWAYPDETIEKKCGDCEDIAILAASIDEYIYISRGEEIYIPVIVFQTTHAYVERKDKENNTVEIGGKVDEEEDSKYIGIIGHIHGLWSYYELFPLWRQVLLFSFIPCIIVFVVILYK